MLLNILIIYYILYPIIFGEFRQIVYKLSNGLFTFLNSSVDTLV